MLTMFLLLGLACLVIKRGREHYKINFVHYCYSTYTSTFPQSIKPLYEIYDNFILILYFF